MRAVPLPTTSATSPSSRLPEVLKRQTNNYTSMVSETANALHDIAGPRDGLAFLVERIDAEPDWFRLNNQDGWSQHCYTLGQWRTEVKDLGEVEKPLLAIVLKELRRDLQSRQQRNRIDLCRSTGTTTGARKRPTSPAPPTKSGPQEKQSGAACQYIAEYLYWGLDHYPRAIEILLDAHRREVLDEGGQSRLVEFLRGQNRFAETIPILEPLVQRRRRQLAVSRVAHECLVQDGQTASSLQSS